MSVYVLVSGDFTTWGGMDRANYGLAWHLAEDMGAEVHLVGYAVSTPLRQHRRVVWHPVPKPLNRYALAEQLLAWQGRRVAAALVKRKARVIVNGGNCAWPDVNWIHAVHAAWDNRAATAPLLFRIRAAWLKYRARRAERRGLHTAGLILANSQRARQQVIDHMGVPPEHVHTVYYGIDSELFRPASPAERMEIRQRLGLPEARPIAVFIGALGYDRNKGFDVLFAAWQALCQDPAWDADLVVVGGGAEVELWRTRSTTLGLSERIRVLGFTKHIPDILTATDALVSPTHYDAYGLGVHEALCCGLPAFVTHSAGVAERYPDNLNDLLLSNPPTADDLVQRLQRWRADMPQYRARIAPFSAMLRQRTWYDMSKDIATLVESSAPV